MRKISVIPGLDMLSFIFRYVVICVITPLGVSHADTGITLLADSVIYVESGLSALDVQISNDTQEEFQGTLVLELPRRGISSLSGTEIELSISPGKKRFLSLKIRPETLSFLKGEQIILKLKRQSGEEVLNHRVQIHVAERKSIVIQDVSEMQYLGQVGDSVKVRVRVINNGTTDESIKLLFSSSDRIGGRDFKPIALNMYAGRDTLIEMRFIVERFMLDLPYFSVRISGLYDNNDVFGSVVIQLPNRLSSRNYQRMYNNDNSVAVLSRNYIDLQWNNLLNQYGMLFLRSSGEYRLFGGEYRYNLSMNQDGYMRYQPNVYHTFLEWEKRGVAYTVGNIQESLEAPFYGRGVQVASLDSLKLNGWSFGVVDKSNDLFSSINGRSSGFSAYGKLVMGDGHEDRKRYEGQFYYDQTVWDSTENILWTNTFDFSKRSQADRIQLKGFVATGLTRYRGEGDLLSDTEPSLAVGAKIIGKGKYWNYNGDHFVSTGYYPGNRRGVVHFSQGISRYFRKINYSLNVLHSSYQPEYFHNDFRGINTKTSRIDMRLQLPVSSFYSFSVQPSYNEESGGFMSQQEYIDLYVRNWRLQTTANLRSRNLKHTLFMNVESGVTFADFSEGTSNFAFRGNVAYNYGLWSLSGSYQEGAFQVYDMFTEFLIGRSFGYRTSLIATYRSSPSWRKIQWDLHAGANFTAHFGDSYSGQLQMRYAIGKSTSLTGQFQCSYTRGVSGYTYTHNNLRVGVRQLIKSQDISRESVKTADMNVFCFYDNNNNHVFDQGDEIAKGYHFMIRDVLFVTDSKGKSTFSKIPPGDYSLQFLLHNGYYAASRHIAVNGKNISLDIALQRVGKVSGSIVIDYDPDLSMDTDVSLMGYVVVAKDRSDKIYQAYTNILGEFEFSLPSGEYTFYVEERGFPQAIYMDDNQQKGIINAEGTLSIKPFELKVRARKVDVKRFGH